MLDAVGHGVDPLEGVIQAGLIGDCQGMQTVFEEPPIAMSRAKESSSASGVTMSRGRIWAVNQLEDQRAGFLRQRLALG